MMAGLLMVLLLAPLNLQGQEADAKQVLFINSYHEGYKWSDDIRASIEAAFGSASYEVALEPFYMDTQRMPTDDPKHYYDRLAKSLSYRLQYTDYDLVITADDAAFQFMVDYGHIFDEDIPHVYCGVNNADLVAMYDEGDRAMGGTLEYIDFRDTLGLMLELHPETKEIYYVLGEGLTAKIIPKILLEAASDYDHQVRLRQVAGDTMAALEANISALPEDALLLQLPYFIDKEGNHYSYDETNRRINEAAKIPVYSLWTVNLGYGIMGGKLLSGEDQGAFAGEMALNYFDKGPKALVGTTINLNRYIFDYRVLKKFDIPLTALPKDADVINFRKEGSKEVLVLHSYNPGFQWTDDMDEGIRSGLDGYVGAYRVATEFMDLKRLESPIYLNHFKKGFEQKYGDTQFDLIITTDDGAFDFARNHLQSEGKTPPIVFCGVNYMDRAMLENNEGYTGVMEAYNVEKTIDAILRLQPEVTTLYIINDQTVTGQGNRRNIEAIEANYLAHLDFNYIEEKTMSELTRDVAGLEEDTAILLMSFNKDRANNQYSYAESIELIYEAAMVPMYGVWDFYMNEGLLGGYLTDGYEQGYQAGKLGAAILAGSLPEEMPIMTTSPNRYVFDAHILDAFGLQKEKLPQGAEIINAPKNFWDRYNESRHMFNIIFTLIALLVLILGAVLLILHRTVRLNGQIKHLATYDHLTGVLNRGSGIEILENYLKSPEHMGQSLAIIFLDLNHLKKVNDRYGHLEGDNYIIKTAEIVQAMLGPKDMLCRMGGDEFMSVLMDRTEEEVGAFVKHVKEALKHATNREEKDYEYSVSMGYNHMTIAPDIDATEAIEKADTNMYEDKIHHKKQRK